MRKGDKEFKKWFLSQLKRRGDNGWLISYRRLAQELQGDIGLELSRDTVCRRTDELWRGGVIEKRFDRSNRRGRVGTFRYSVVK